MTLEETREIVRRVAFWNYLFAVIQDGDQRYLQASFLNTDSVTGQPAMQKTRKWLLSEHMVPSEVVQTCFKLVMTSVEHEIRESFTYRDAKVFGPHFDVEALVELCRRRRLDYRRHG